MNLHLEINIDIWTLELAVYSKDTKVFQRKSISSLIAHKDFQQHVKI